MVHSNFVAGVNHRHGNVHGARRTPLSDSRCVIQGSSGSFGTRVGTHYHAPPGGGGSDI